ncbi:MAG: class D sortase [Bryobacteraceae bacterium]
MKRFGNILLLAGSAVLAWCLLVYGGAALFNRYENWQFTRAVEGESPSAHAAAEPKLHDVIGRLDIPRLHVSTIVLEGDDAHALRLGAGHVPGTALPDSTGNVGIAAHRDTIFRPLRRIRPHDRILLTTMDGAFQYAVESTEIVSPADTAVLNSTGGQELTLVTCYPFYYIGSAPKRFIVHARRVRPSSAS